MKPITILAIGRLKPGPYQDLSQDYLKRITWPVVIKELEAKHADPARQRAMEGQKILESRNKGAVLFLLDERGKSFTSANFAKLLEQTGQIEGTPIDFAIGGADGHDDAIKDAAKIHLCLGVQTWPHRLVRVMLLEQIYRAQQILSGHPYHRE